MDEKPENIDDDILDDDLDFDDDDSLDDDSWDDFDDADDAQDDIAEAQPVASSPKKKSFLSKNFNLIVIAVAVLGGGGWFFTQMSSPTTAPENAVVNLNQAEQSTAAEDPVQNLDVSAELSDSSALPPMPAPINSVEAEEAQAAQIETSPAPEASLDDILTPMPVIAPAETVVAEVSPLDDLINDAPVQEKDVDTLDAILPIETAEEIVKPEIIEETADNSIEAAPLASPVEDVQALLQVETPPIEAEPLAAEDDVPSSEVPEIVAPQISGAVAEDIISLENRLDKIESTSTALSAQIQSTSDAIGDLSLSVQTLQKSIDEMSRPEKAPTPAPAEKVDTAPKTVPKEEAKAVAPAPKKPAVKKATTMTVAKKEWQLRSAQPGKAILKAKGTGDLLNVKVGNTVDGLGKITSIALEDGLWVVKGTIGSVTQ